MWTLNRANGDDVPTPTKPLLVTIKFVAVEDPTTNWLAASPAVGLMEKLAQGVEVPVPTFPFSVKRKTLLLKPPESLVKNSIEPNPEAVPALPIIIPIRGSEGLVLSLNSNTPI